MKVNMVATKAMPYRTRQLKAGDEFEADANQVRIFEAVWGATRAPAKVAEPPVPTPAPAAPVVEEERPRRGRGRPRREPVASDTDPFTASKLVRADTETETEA